MRKAIYELDNVREKISELKGCNVKMLINRGRKKIVRLSGILEDTYPSVFTIRVAAAKHSSLVTYSYSDVLCGDVKICAE